MKDGGAAHRIGPKPALVGVLVIAFLLLLSTWPGSPAAQSDVATYSGAATEGGAATDGRIATDSNIATDSSTESTDSSAADSASKVTDSGTTSASNGSTRLSATPQKLVPILMYHVIAPGPNNLYVPPEEFEQHLGYLSKKGYQSVTLQQLYAHFTKGEPLPEQAVAITFDDGYESVYSAALPVMKEYGMVGTFFIITDRVGKPGYVTWDQLKEMVAAGMEIGSHTVSHPDLRNVNAEGLKRELGESRSRLEEELGVQVHFFAYPGGRFNDQTLAAMDSYYQAAVTTVNGMATPCQERFLWQRIRVGQHLGPERFGSLLASQAETSKRFCP